MPVMAMMLHSGAAGGGGSGPFHRSITIDHTKVGSTDQTNFPVLFSGTYTYLKTVANGGKVQNSNGYDIGFYSDSGLTTKLDWEIETWNGTTGEINAWVRVPTVSHTSDTVIYIGYADSGITTDQSNKTGVWDTNYKMVMHLADGSTLNTTDSTSNGNSMPVGNNSAPVPSATTGKIDGGASFVAASQNAITINDVASLRATDHFTVSCWYKPTSLSSYNVMIGKGDGTTLNYFLETTGEATPHVRAGFTQGVANYVSSFGVTGLSTGVWIYMGGTYDGANIKAFLNGALDHSQAQTGNADNPTAGSGQLAIGRSGNYTGGAFSDGVIDEPRVSIGIARSADWFLSEYNNQSSPSTFYAVGAET